MALPTPIPEPTIPIIRFEAKGIGIYEVGCLNNKIWNKNFVKDKFIWVLESYKGDEVSIAGYANETGLTLMITLNDVIVEQTTIKPHEYGSISYIV